MAMQRPKIETMDQIYDIISRRVDKLDKIIEDLEKRELTSEADLFQARFDELMDFFAYIGGQNEHYVT
jgi:hypothetical protein